MSSFWYCVGKRRQAANRTGQGNDNEDREDTEDQIVTHQEGGSSVEEPAAGNTNNVLIVDIE